ncbi:ATP-dependent helicase [Halobacteriaceae archaeon GCM10025711]
MAGVLDTGFDWTNDQERVIEHRDGALQVIACAGSGKTHTISARIAQMIHNGVERDNILAFTFTENAAEELKVRIREWMARADLDDQGLGDMAIDTIHTFCRDLLHEYVPETRSYDVLSDNELAAFISQHYFDINLHLIEPRHPEAKYQKIKWFTEDIDTMRRELLVDEMRRSGDETAQQLMGIYDEFRDLMDEYHFFDYEELIYRTVKLLENDEDVLEEVRSQYQYITVDEHQDVNRSQARLIELLAGENANLCVVGDDDQSIYGWRGAQPEDFRNFVEEYGAETETLAQNFRSTEAIVDLARSVIERNNDRLDKPMNSDRGYDIGDNYQLYFDHEDDEVEFIVNRIEELQGTVYENPNGEERTLRWGDVGILFRRKRDMDAIQDELEERDIPYTIRGQNNIFSHPVAQVVRLAFAYIARGQEDDPDYIGDIPIEIIDAQTSRPDDHEPINRFAVTEDDLRTAITNSRLLREREDEIVARLNDIQDWYRNPSSRRIEPQEELHKILAAMGIAQLPPDADANDDGFPESVMYNIGQISDLIKDFETVYEIIFPDQITELVDFLDYAYFYGRSEVDDETLVNAVDLLTIHSAKGMEYPAVFVPGLTKLKFDNTPSRSFRRHTEWIPGGVFDYQEYHPGEEEKRRLFYVAATRAQKFLSLTGSLWNYKNFQDNVMYEQRQNESQFYEEARDIDHEGVLYEPTPDPTPREPREIPAHEQDYVYPTSFSELRYYQKCPYDFKLRKIYNFAPPIDQAFGYGFAVHDVLHEMHERHEGDNQSMVMSPGEIRQRVQDEDRFHLRYADGHIDEDLRATAEEQLTRYSQQYQDDLVNTFRSEVPFEILLTDEENAGTALVSGAIDLIERRDPETDEIRELDIIDFKTSDQPTDKPEQLRDHRFQVRLYGLATRVEFDPQDVDGFIHYLSEDEDERLEVDLADPRVNQVEGLVRQHVSNIMGRRFFADPSEEICSDCDFSLICPHAETDN